jgi:hypothetical protein
MGLGWGKRGGGGGNDRQPLQNIIITILYHEYFSHGTSTFNGNNVSKEKLRSN